MSKNKLKIAFYWTASCGGCEIEELLSQVKDTVGTFYMYSLPASILKRKVIKK
jgi:coenzyme F420-reducing hydrogenase gamma subunit